MSTAVATMKKVQGIIPMGDLLKEMGNPLFDRERFLSDLVSEENVKELSDSVSVGEEKTKRKKIKEKISESRFKKIRERMIAETLGISLDELKAYRKDSAAFVEGSAPSNTEADILRDRRRVWRGQVGSNKRDQRDMVWTIMSGVIVPILSQFPAVSALIATIPGAQIAIIAVPLIAAFVVYKKGRKGNIADAIEKFRAYMEKHKQFMEKAKLLEAKIEDEQELIAENKKNMAPEEYDEWYQEYINGLKALIKANFKAGQEGTQTAVEEIEGE